ncbi:nuclear pore complex protein Nup153 isoform X2 [Engraulis encrasicolus]|uniref:nuclear pore complex protein Nup153 isoform X2 n=1 Tax=Engraulis encrasicolus TaxID=184585 RepID=UPI002FD2F5A1
MAATGGGKIRSRRYHITSKPYAKGKQAGLISRVTDTVKSIVPSWLQKYFKNGEVAEGPAASALAGPELDGQASATAPNGNEDGGPLPDGRDTPEPSTSNTEPSTSRASLNFNDVLSRPPLNRSHLHFASLDSSAVASAGLGLGGSSSLFPQPSTSSAAGGPFGSPFPLAGASTSAAGPFGSPFVSAGGASTSGFSLVKEIKDNSSQHDDDNISTTSGFSSRASDKDVPTSKPAPLLWSPETDRTHSGSHQHAAQTGLKKPAFNLSVFGNSTLSTSMNASVLNSSQLGDSPYYPGKTTYGGASATRSTRSRPSTPYQVPVRRQIKAKPAGAQPCGVTSATARRILQSLERMSSPLADAKRIPSTISSPLSSSLDRTDLESSPFQVKKKKMDVSLPPVKRLVVPTAAASTSASTSGSRSMLFRPSLTPGGINRALERTASRDTPVRKSPVIPDATPIPSQSTSSPAYPLSSTPAVSASAAGSGGGKMKRERATTRASSKRPDDEVAEMPDLPAISLPISTRALPTFSFSSPSNTSTPTPAPVTVPAPSPAPAPAPTKAAPTPQDTPATKDPPVPSTPPSLPFTFASPIVKATPASPPSFSPTSGFTFSAPVMKTGLAVSNDSAAASPITLAVKSPPSAETKAEFEGPFKPAKTLKQGSVLDLLKAPGFASSTPTSTPSSSSTPAPALPLSGFGDKFKPASGSWSCDTCMVQNVAADSKCVACQTSKPQKDSSSSSSSSKLDSKPPAVSVSASSGPGLASLFAPTAGTWECDTCLVQNKPDALKCVACDTAKPGTGVKPGLTLPSSLSTPSSSSFSSSATTTAAGTPDAAAATTTSSSSGGLLSFGEKFKKPEGSWECDTCMVQNKAQDAKCVACQTAKPGASSAAPASLPPLSSSSTAPLVGFGDKFKKAEGSWECDVCCVQNKGDDLQCVACQTNKPGAKVEPKASVFGSSAASDSSSGGFKFGLSSSSSSSSTPAASTGGFKFGTTATDSSSSSSAPSGGFKFGGSSTSDSSSGGGFKFGGASDSSSSTGGFKFGSTAASDSSSTATTEASTGGFTFGLSSSSTSSSEDSKKADAPSLGGGFKFGSSSGGSVTFGMSSATPASSTPPPASVTDSPAPSTGFTFGLSKPEETTTTDTTTTAAPAPTFSFSTPQDSSSSAAATTTSSLPVFGEAAVAAPKEPTLSAPTFSFEKDASAAAPAVSSSGGGGFVFGAVKEPEKSVTSTAPVGGGFTFGKTDVTAAAPAAAAESTAPVFSFGKPAEKSEPEDSKPSFTFGGSTDASATKPAFGGFMAAASSSTPSTTPPAPSLFGASASTTTSSLAAPAPAPASTGTFLFGQSSATDAPPAKAPFLFGSQPQDVSTAPAAPAATSATPSQPFLFGASTTAAAPPPYPFGAATSSTPASAAPSPFSFSGAPSSGGFGSFGQAATQQPAAPAFGSSTPSFSAATSQPPAFGAKPSAAPVFGQAANATPAFGSSSTTAGQGGGFQFGGASAFGAPAAAGSGIFTFGGGPNAAAPAAAPQPTAPGGGFAFNSTPAFNIGSVKSSGGPPTPIAGRKIKTAVRRRK